MDGFDIFYESDKLAKMCWAEQIDFIKAVYTFLYYFF